MLFDHLASISSRANRAAQNLRRDCGGHRSSFLFEALLRPRRLLSNLLLCGVDLRGHFRLYFGDHSLPIERRFPTLGFQTLIRFATGVPQPGFILLQPLLVLAQHPPRFANPPGPQTLAFLQNLIDRLEERAIEYVDQQEDGKEYE
jgi:hypothetical protein